MSDDDLRPDALDDELRRRFDAGGAAADPDPVLDSLRPRLQRARTRRRASAAGVLAGLAVVVVALFLALGPGGGGDRSVRTPPASGGPVTTGRPDATTTTGGTAPTVDTRPEPGGTTATSVPSTAPGTAPAATPGTTAASTAPTPPSSSDYSSAGGSITVRVADGRVSLVRSAPAPGYTAEVHDDGPTRVEVRFSDGKTEWRIRVDLTNGVLVSEVTQHGA
jgi:hypothetical protein